ncbi:uncharacterized protein METZ01_LOCUS313351 [marine metagenome]|uniref:Uncharacterized protein n=1 Tax=marine metagenome TaxID=408172 RepID=A0A382NJM3_9ZZZZ
MSLLGQQFGESTDAVCIDKSTGGIVARVGIADGITDFIAINQYGVITLHAQLLDGGAGNGAFAGT